VQVPGQDNADYFAAMGDRGGAKQGVDTRPGTVLARAFRDEYLGSCNHQMVIGRSHIDGAASERRSVLCLAARQVAAAFQGFSESLRADIGGQVLNDEDRSWKLFWKLSDQSRQSVHTSRRCPDHNNPGFGHRVSRLAA